MTPKGSQRTVRAARRCAPICAALLVACVGGDVEPEEVDPCSEISIGSGDGSIPAATSGGDHGPPWQPPEPVAVDDTMSEKLDVGFGIPDLGGGIGLDWERDPVADLHYRRPTENEIVANKWGGNVLLVSLPNTLLRNLRAGVTPLVFRLPLADAAPWSQQHDLPVLEVELSLRVNRSSIGVVQHRVVSPRTVLISASRPTFRTYVQVGLNWGNIDDTALRVTARDHGGIVAVGATYGRHFWLEGPYDDRLGIVQLDLGPDQDRQVYVLHTVHGALLSNDLELEDDDVAGSIQNISADDSIDVLAAGPDAAESHVAGVVHQCTDGLNNDPQLGPYDADGCDFSCMPHPDFGTDAFPGVFPVLEYGKPFAIVGDAEWCTRHLGDGEEDMDWAEILVTMGEATETMLNQVEAPPEILGPRVPPFRLVGVHCFFFPTLEAAMECHDDGICSGAMADYPFKGVGKHWGCVGPDCAEPDNTTTYLHRVWDVADLWAADVLDVNAFDAAHPIQHIAVVTPRGDLYEPYNEVNGGQAFYPTDLHVKYAGGAVVRSHVDDTELGPIGVGWRIAHEFGHTYGLAHDDAKYEDDEDLRSFMYFSGGPAPILSVKDDPDTEDVDESSSAIPGETQYGVWTQLAPRKWNPRPPGFGWIGCDPDDTSFCPSPLSCVELGPSGSLGSSCREVP